jgi:hypothetical protein
MSRGAVFHQISAVCFAWKKWQGLGLADRYHAAKGGGPVGSINPTASEVAAS